MNKKIFTILFAATVVAVSLSQIGCAGLVLATGSTPATIGHAPLEKQLPQKSEDIVLRKLIDGRTEDHKRGREIGNKRNAYGMVLGNMSTHDSISLDSVLTEYFAESLRNVGYTVRIVPAIAPSDATSQNSNVLEG